MVVFTKNHRSSLYFPNCWESSPPNITTIQILDHVTNKQTLAKDLLASITTAKPLMSLESGKVGITLSVTITLVYSNRPNLGKILCLNLVSDLCNLSFRNPWKVKLRKPEEPQASSLHCLLAEQAVWKLSTSASILLMVQTMALLISGVRGDAVDLGPPHEYPEGHCSHHGCWWIW